MLTSRQRIFIILSVVIGLILVFLLLYLFVFNQNRNQNQATDEKTGQLLNSVKENSPAESNVAVGNAKPALTAEPFSQEVYARQVARIFVERFASYSNQNNNQHLADVLPLATDGMAEWLNTRGLQESGEFEGLTTVVVASAVTKITGQAATVRVDTQQTSEKGSEQKISQRGGRVELVKINGDWKVDGFYWDK